MNNQRQRQRRQWQQPQQQQLQLWQFKNLDQAEGQRVDEGRVEELVDGLEDVAEGASVPDQRDARGALVDQEQDLNMIVKMTVIMMPMMMMTMTWKALRTSPTIERILMERLKLQRSSSSGGEP